MWSLAAVLLAFPRLDRLRTAVPGDPGDAFFNLTLLEWGANRLPHLFQGYWKGYFFVGGTNVMAYSETHLGIVPIHFVLRNLTGSPVVSMNLIYLASWALACEWTYRLCRYLGASPTGSVVGAFAYTFAAIRLGQHGHFHLVLGALIPLVVLLTLRLCDRPSVRTVVAFGIAFPVMMLSASYYGVIMAISCVIIVAGRFLLDRRAVRANVWHIGAAALLAIALVAPVAFQYLRLQRDPHFQRDYDSQFAMRWPDLRLPADGNRWVGQIGILSSNDFRSSENLAFPGIAVAVLAPVGLYALVRRRAVMRRGALALVLVCGAVASLLAFGRNLALGHTSLSFYDASALVVPGMRTMRALVRLVVVGQLAAAVLAAIGATVVLLRRRAALAVAIGVAMAAFVLFELSTQIDMVTVPPETAANRLLGSRPRATTLEWPIASADHGAAWAYSESPRLLLGTHDWQPRLNGYSGFWAPDYLPMAAVLNTLPSPDAIEELRYRQVRYLVIRTAPVLVDAPPFQALVEHEGVGPVDAATAERVVAALRDAELVASVENVSGAVVVTLR